MFLLNLSGQAARKLSSFLSVIHTSLPMILLLCLSLSLSHSLARPLDGYELRLEGGDRIFPWTRMASLLSPLTAFLALRHVKICFRMVLTF